MADRTNRQYCAPCQNRGKGPVYCAPQRCYCGHTECPAAGSYAPTR